MAIFKKTNEINIYLSDNEKEFLNMAADIKHQTLPSYIYDAMMKQVRNDMRNQSIILENNERDLFLELMDNPPEPNERLKNLYK
ncbi:MAG: DUF1778 domain-containing protein [Bacilli bacterium]|nr:DUF1778 domain-containing protein [Bacilli bacterium]